MTVGTVPCYRRDCAADAGHQIKLMSGEVRDVCFQHLHDFVLEVGSSAPIPQHVAGYAKWRHQQGLPELDPDDTLRLVTITRNESGYRFTDWEY